MKQTKLSKQQKAILNILHEEKSKSERIGSLSYKIARKFNKGHDDRIWNKEQHIKKYHDDPFIKVFMRNKQKENLTKKHRASFSRSLSRLEKRGLINKKYYPQRPITLAEYNRRYEEDPLYVSKDRATHISLTKKGLKYFESGK